VTVAVPATCANIGPGFDCFGIALSWSESVRLEVIDAGFHIDVTGEGADALPRDESHLIIRSALTGFADLGVQVPGLRLRCRNTIPHGSGLGSSSAAIVGGLLAARALAGLGMDQSWLLQHATAIEGHPDNVAAAIYGGFVMAYGGSAGVTTAQGRVAEDVGAVVWVPDTAVATEAARGLLPELVPHEDAAANSGRAGLLVHALATDLDLLHDATREWLHQDYRSRAMPESFELMGRLRGEGFAAVISGSGPTVLVLGHTAAMDELSERRYPGFTAVRAGLGSGAAVTLEPAHRLTV
jgi:homoserine kinase